MPIGIEKTLIDSSTVTSNAVSVAITDTLVLAANNRRRMLIIQRGTTVGRVFVKFSSGAATVTNGLLMRENAYLELSGDMIYTGEIRAIAVGPVGTTKILYVTEVTV